MKIRIIGSSPKTGEYGIEHLIGKEFEVIKTDDEGHYIKHGDTDLYLVHESEFEIIEGGN